MTTETCPFGDTLTRVMVNNGIRHKGALAERLGCHRNKIGALLSGREPPTAAFLARIKERLTVDKDIADELQKFYPTVEAPPPKPLVQGVLEAGALAAVLASVASAMPGTQLEVCSARKTILFLPAELITTELVERLVALPFTPPFTFTVYRQ